MNAKIKLLFIATTLPAISFSVVSSEFNLNFLKGGADGVEGIEKLSFDGYVSGQYLVNVSLNGKDKGKRLISISEEDTNELCLSADWLTDADIHISHEYYKDYFDAKRQCYVIEKGQSSDVQFDFAAQNISFNLPQKGLLSQAELASVMKWDYGMPALRFNYNANVNMNDVNTTTYGSADIIANVGKWVASSSMSVNDNSFDLSTVSATRALYNWKSDLTIGKVYTGGSLVGGTGLIGVSLASNSSMKPNDLGYSPIFSGVANSNARVTLSQNGRAIYSEMVPPGPFEISNANLLSSGDVTMTITENDGSVTTQMYPLTIIPNMLNPGSFEYAFYTGVRDSGEDKLSGVFTAADVGYGFDAITLKSSALVHSKYLATGASVISRLGSFGTLGLEGQYSRAKYDNDEVFSGSKVSITYAKKLAKDTNLQIAGAQYSSKNYTEFSEFNPEAPNDRRSKQKQQYDVTVSHQLTNKISSGLSGWHRTYWDDAPSSTGINARVNTNIGAVSLSFGAGYAKSNNRDNYNASLNISIPLDFSGKKYSSFGNVTYNSHGYANYTAGISSSIGNRIDYSTSVGVSNNENTYSLQSSYRGDRALLRGQLSQGSNGTTGSASMTGSVVILPTKMDFILTRNVNDTIAIANVANTKGVEFISSPYPTNSKGNAIVPISAYRVNNITLSGDTLPSDTELMNTSKRIVPTSKAVVDMRFETLKVKRYLFQVKDKNGNFIPTSTWAESLSGVPLGFVTQNGVLFVNAIDKLDGFRVGSCHIDGKSIKETTELQEVICEK